MNSLRIARLHAHPGRQRSARLFVATAASCVLVAALLTLLGPSRDSFWRNLWFSECIGLSIAACAVAVRQLPQLHRVGRPLGFALALVFALPVGYVLGYALAYTGLGEPVRIGGPASTRLVMLATTVLATGVIGYLAWLRNRLHDEERARALAQQLAAQAELRMLRAQLQPHMLFNTLANLRSLVEEDPAQAVHMIDLLITYLRGALAGSRADSASLADEFAQLAAYLDILSLRLGRRLRYELDLPQELQQVTVPSMLLQPLVENAVKHGIEPKVGGGTITVHARRGAGGLEIVVIDTGAGLPAESSTPTGSGSYGLMHVRERLRALYGRQGTLRLEPHEPGGTRAIVSLPA